MYRASDNAGKALMVFYGVQPAPLCTTVKTSCRGAEARVKAHSRSLFSLVKTPSELCDTQHHPRRTHLGFTSKATIDFNLTMKRWKWSIAGCGAFGQRVEDVEYGALKAIA
jgi:hypothetical protein